MSAARRLLLIACLAVGPAGANGEAAPAGWRDTIRQIDALRLREGIAMVGIALVERDRTVWAGALGVVSHESEEPAGADTLIRIGSITKTFTALAMLQAVEGGHLSLDDPIRRWLPAGLYQNPWADSHPIRVAQLLEHTAGFRGLSKLEFDYSDPAEIGLEDALRLSADTHVARWPPGMHPSYTNLGAGFAGLILERVTGRAYRHWVEKEIFAPLGMPRSGLRGDSGTLKALAAGYDSDAVSRLPYWHMVFPPFGAINSTTGEMARFVRMLINRGRLDGKRVVAESAIARMETPRTSLAARQGMEFGYGLGNYQWYRDGVLFHGHGGDADGYLSHFGYSRENDKGYFVVITAFKKPVLNDIRELIETRLIEGLAPPEPMPEARLGRTYLKELTGYYLPATRRFGDHPPGPRANRRGAGGMEITLEQGSLYRRLGGGRKQRLIPVSKHLFRRSDRPRPTSALLPQEDGSVIYQDTRRNLIKQPVN